MWEIFLIAPSLAMDSFSVSIAGGAKLSTEKKVNALKVAVFFGVFQALMPIIGWLTGRALQSHIAAIDHWVASLLLSVIGLKMIKDVYSANQHEYKNILDLKTLILLAIATSIDALIIGITLNLLKTPFLISIGIIGAVTFFLSYFGFIFGNRLGKIFGKKVEISGGMILILISIKILIEHLYS